MAHSLTAQIAPKWRNLFHSFRAVALAGSQPRGSWGEPRGEGTTRRRRFRCELARGTSETRLRSVSLEPWLVGRAVELVLTVGRANSRRSEGTKGFPALFGPWGGQNAKEMAFPGWLDRGAVRKRRPQRARAPRLQSGRGHAREYEIRDGDRDRGSRPAKDRLEDVLRLPDGGAARRARRAEHARLPGLSGASWFAPCDQSSVGGAGHAHRAGPRLPRRD
jgi:hypothetical protein